MKVRLILALVCTIGASTFSSAAIAGCGGCVAADAVNAQAPQTRAQIQRSGESIVQAIVRSTNSLIQAMQQTAGNAVHGINQNTAAIAKQQGDDAARISRAQVKEQAAVAAQAGIAVMECSSTSSSSATTPTPKGSGRGGYDPHDGNASERWKAAVASTSTVPPETQNPPPNTQGVQVTNVGLGGCETFAREGTLRGALCELSGTERQVDTPYANADIKADTLFIGPQDVSQNPTPMMSVPGAGDERVARQAYLAMIDDPLPPYTPSAAAGTTQAFDEYLGLWARYQALLSMASEPAYAWDKWTTIDPSTSQALADIALDPTGATFLSEHFKRYPRSPNSTTDEVSQAELMEIEVERRIGNKDWVLKMARSDEKAKQAEMMMMQAYSMRINHQLLVEQRKTNILLGQIMAMEVQSSLRKELDAKIAEANDAGTRRLMTGGASERPQQGQNTGR